MSQVFPRDVCYLTIYHGRLTTLSFIGAFLMGALASTTSTTVHPFDYEPPTFWSCCLSRPKFSKSVAVQTNAYGLMFEKVDHVKILQGEIESQTLPYFLVFLGHQPRNCQKQTFDSSPRAGQHPTPSQ